MPGYNIMLKKWKSAPLMKNVRKEGEETKSDGG